MSMATPPSTHPSLTPIPSSNSPRKTKSALPNSPPSTKVKSTAPPLPREKKWIYFACIHLLQGRGRQCLRIREYKMCLDNGVGKVLLIHRIYWHSRIMLNLDLRCGGSSLIVWL